MSNVRHRKHLEYPMASSLSSALVALQAVLPSNIVNTLRPPVAPCDLAELEAAFAGEVPAEVSALLTWHDGQEWNSPLSPDDNRRLLSCREIVETLSFFADPNEDYLRPWKQSWIPLLTNDSGDYVVIETTGEAAGSLLTYWHDDESRRQVESSLMQWVQGLQKAYPCGV